MQTPMVPGNMPPPTPSEEQLVQERIYMLRMILLILVVICLGCLGSLSLIDSSGSLPF